MSDQLKPCPFCGSENIHIYRAYEMGCDDIYASCNDCNSRTDDLKTFSQVRVAWNTRHIPWHKYPEEKPEEGELVIFEIFETEGNTHLNGHIYGGPYSDGCFYTPGVAHSAIRWISLRELGIKPPKA